MTHALGEFGKAKNSEQASAITGLLASNPSGIAPMDIFKLLSTEFESINQCLAIIQNLKLANKIEMASKGGVQVVKLATKINHSKVMNSFVREALVPEFTK